MKENGPTLYPHTVEIFGLNIKRNFQESADEPELIIIPKIFNRRDKDFIARFEITFTFTFQIQLEIIAIYREEKIIEINDDELIKMIVSDSYPIYSKVLIILGFLFDQMGFNAYYMPYSRFIELSEKGYEH